MRSTKTILFLAAVLVACAPAEPVSIRVIDGDTIDAGLSNNVRLTLDDGSGFDTPETFRSGCAREARLGELASARLRQIVRDADDIDLEVGSRSCGFGRYCGALRVDGTNVGTTLIREGLARPSKNYDWCQGA